MLDLIKGDVVVIDGYKGDTDTRVLVVDKPIWQSKGGVALLTARDVARNVFRSYYVSECANLRRAKS